MIGKSYRTAIVVLLSILWAFSPLCSFADRYAPSVMLLYSSEEYGKLQSGDDWLKNYTRALTSADIRPVPASPAHIVPLSSVEGVVVPGGKAVTPSLYRKATEDRSQETDLEFDRYELSVLDEAWSLDMPIVGICRGEELLNVFRGGSLHDDLAATVGIREGVEHRNPRTKKETFHIITIKEGTLLFSMLKAHVKIVNSHHRLAVKDTGRDLAVTACSPDGIIECLEAPGKPFCIGLQWHPEKLASKDRVFAGIFLRLHDEALS